MEAMATLYEASPTAAHAATLRQLVNLITCKGINRHFGYLGEEFDQQWRPREPWRRPVTVSYGHEVEAAWRFISAIRDAWAESPDPDFPNYEPDTPGPAETNRLLNTIQTLRQ